MTASRVCVLCGKTFYKAPTESLRAWDKPSRRFCSQKCANIDKVGKHYPQRHNPVIVRPTQVVTLPSKSVIHWNENGTNDEWRQVPVTCGRCGVRRVVSIYNAYRKVFNGLCRDCNLSITGKANGGNKHPSWRGGHFISNNGYPEINIRALSGRTYEIASQMARVVHGRPAIVGEHRLVMAIHLDRPLLPSEVVHHKNGNKRDNRLENLEITTGSDHRKLDVKYYDLWQDALRRIAELEMQLLRFQSGQRG